MKAAVLNAIPGQLEIEDIEIGEPGPREVLITTKAAGLCHSDLHHMEGKYPHPCPAVLGHESAGVVEFSVKGPKQRKYVNVVAPAVIAGV